MSPTIDATHDPALMSWVESANENSDFPIQNLPFGVFSDDGGGPRGGVAIGDQILDLAAADAAGLFSGVARSAARAASGASLNGFLALEPGLRRNLRQRLSALLAFDGDERRSAQAVLRQARDCVLHLPAEIGDYTDFYAGLHHATNVGRQFRPEEPLLANYKHVPIGYHGRASSVRPSGTLLRRPNGQRRAPGAAEPTFGPSRRLDFELELGIWIGRGNTLGEAIPIAEAGAHVAGVCLLNDWSAREVQAWEYQPLGPFLAKNFMTTVSPWIVTAEALAPFRIPQPRRPDGDPAPLPYLWDARDQASGAYAIDLDAHIATAEMRRQGLAAHRLSRSAARHLYWTPAQLVAHHASGGCNLRPGDLLGTGTISAPQDAGLGSLLEITQGGRRPLSLPTGETRGFLEDGDEITLTGRASADGYASIGFGDCRGVVLAAP